MESIKKQLENLKAETKKAIINLAGKRCEVDMNELQIRQSFSYYEDEVYHIEKLYIYPEEDVVRVQLIEYADSIEISEFSADDQIAILGELEKAFAIPKYDYRIDYY